MDSVIQSTFHHQAHTDQLTHVQKQVSESIILTRNAELRKNPGVVQDLGSQGNEGSWGRQVASIPIIMYEAACRAGYDLKNPNAGVAGKEMSRYLQSPEGKMCLVQG